MFKIEKNVPIEAYKPHYKYPFKDMEILDSFFIPVGRVKDESEPEYKKRVRRVQILIFTSAYKYGKDRKNGFKLITRANDKGVRVWRKS